jgi:hypothetical protein
VRVTHAFVGTFPFFAADRMRTRVAERRRPERRPDPDESPPLPAVSPLVERLLMGVTALDRRVLPRRDLPVGSSVLVVGRRPHV